jgi:hypothetical protein
VGRSEGHQLGLCGLQGSQALLQCGHVSPQGLASLTQGDGGLPGLVDRLPPIVCHMP